MGHAGIGLIDYEGVVGNTTYTPTAEELATLGPPLLLRPHFRFGLRGETHFLL